MVSFVTLKEAAASVVDHEHEQIDALIDGGEPEGLLRFIRDNGLSQEELLTALKVIDRFAGLESDEEALFDSSLPWAKLNQLRDYLRLLAGTDTEEASDPIAAAYLAILRGQTKA